MDNDDNDYQGQNLHVVGEERSQISSVLHPYALPKFDFDDNLQVHLRFDSLVENEVFLGIPSQEENHWIEDFSRGSSGIEFNSSAAEPCSIPRRNNVWSEATSSESVEMLLKSVGQEAMVPGEPVTEHSGISDELGTPPKQMEPNFKQDEKKDNQDPDQALPAVELLGNTHGLDQSARVVDVGLKCASETQEVQQSAFDCQVADIEKCSLVLSEETVQTGATHASQNQEKAGSSLYESLNNRTEEALINSVMLSNKECSSQNIGDDVGNLSGQDKVSDKHLEGENIQREEICEGLQEKNPLNNDSSVNDESLSRSLAYTPSLCGDSQLYVASKMETTQEHVESNIRNIEESSSFPEKREPVLPTAEGNNQDLSSVSQGCQTSVVLVISETNSTDKCDESSVASQVDEFDMHATVSRGVEADAIHADLERAKSSLLQTHGHSSATEAEKICGGSHSLMNRVISDTTSEAYASRVDCEPQKKVSESNITHLDNLPSLTATLHKQVAESSTTRVQDIPSLTTSVSTESVPEKHVIENPKGDNAGAHGEVVSLYVQTGMQMSMDNISADKIDILNSGQDVSVCEKGDLRNVDSEADVQRLSPSSLDDEVRENVETPLGFKLDNPMTNESVPDAGASDTNTVLVDTSDEVPTPSVNGATEEITNPSKRQESISPVVLSMDVDKQEEMGVGPSEANISNLKESLCVESESRDSEGDKSTSGNVAAKVVIKVDDSVPTGDISNIASQDVRVAADKRTIEEESSQKFEVDPIPCGSTLAAGENVEVAAEGKHQETKIENNNGKEFPKVSGACNFVDNKPIHDSARLSCTELPETEKGPTSVGVENAVQYGSTREVVDKAASTPISGVSDTSREERSFTFDVRPLTGLSEGETRNSWQSFPNIKACSVSKNGKASSPTSSGSQKDHHAVQDSSHATPRAPESGSPAVGAKSTSERKTRRGSGKAGKDSKKGDAVKETPVKQSMREDKQFAAVSPLGTGQLLQFEVGNTERSGAKSTASVPTSNLPDLNTSVPTTVLFHQPFTDLQQVQLRAQIFVYGSLIQGGTPDEACMVSAFGTSDGGRSAWESSWRACLGRLHGQKSIANNHDTTVQSRSGSKAQDHLTKQGLPQSRALPSPASRLSSKGTPPPAVNPVIPLSSPLWNISTPSCDGLPSGGVARGAVLDYQALPPLHPYQVSPMRPFGAHTTTWLSQAPFPGPWVASQSSPFDFSARFSSLPTSETVKLTPVKDPSLAISSGSKQVPTVPVGGGSNTFGGTSTIHDVKKMAGTPVPHSADPKSRKRKKSNIIEDPVHISLTATVVGALPSPVISSHSSKKSSVVELGPITLLPRNQRESVFAPVISSHFSTSVAVTASPSCLPISGSDKFLVAASPAILSTNHMKRMGVEKVDMHGENFSKVEEAKQQAEEAAAHAASAVSCCQSVWSQLDKQRNPSLATEEKLASAAVAIAAAASVAKAAAAAAKIASNAAVQAKQMADEALISTGTDIPVRESSLFSPSISNSLENATTPSILKGVDGNKGSNLIISSAREAARKRLEATSAASKHAENLDAIVKAAELAAEAVSQAGFVVAMGEPLPLNVLVGAGPERYWKGSEVPSGHVVKCGTEKGDKSNTESLKEVPELSERQSDQGMDTKDKGRSPVSREISRTMEESIRMEDKSASMGRSKKDLSTKKDRKASDIAKAIRSKPRMESRIIQGAQENLASIFSDNNIKEGCLVEVFKDGGRFKGAWYVANVLSLDNGKALVCYNELQSDEGSELLREWVPLHREGIDVPIIRIPHPVTSMGFEGTRKRRRAVSRDYNWSVGDRVDVWLEDCWREGIISEKDKKDQTSLTVQFPAQGETSVVRAWHLRPTLVWKDGEWIELPSSSQNASSQSDTPQDKRQKLGSPAIEGKGKGKMARSMDVVGSEKDEPNLLPLSKSEKVFNIGSNRGGNNAAAPRIMRSGLQKEGSKVIFGVPKPGKKRKFMEVSKHYSEGMLKNTVSSDSVKFSKYMMPQGLGSRGWKNNSKIDAKEKQAGELKSKALKSGKLPSVSNRTLPQKEKSLLPVAATHETTVEGLMIKDSISKDVNESGQQNLTEFGSVSNMEEVTEASLSSQDLPSRANKKPSTSSKSERLAKGKLVQAGAKSTKAEVEDKTIPEATEPRRSNRRIQPTSRLLEGLQSSLIISKVPSTSHDKIHRNRAIRGTNNRS